MDWDLTYKDLIKKIGCNTESSKCPRHWYESCPGTLDQEHNTHEDDKKLNKCQWDTMDREILTTFIVTQEEYKETLIDVINDLPRHFYISKVKITTS